MKALIITYYWPPAGGSGVQRWLKFVKYLQEFDIEPIVYTVQNPKYPIEDFSLLDQIPKNTTVLKQPILEPNNFLSFLKKNKKQSAGFLNKKPSFFGKILQYIRANYFIPDARKFWIQPSVKYLKNYLTKNNIDLIITTGPPHSLHLIGLALKEQLAIKWISDFRDPWTDIDYFHQLPLTNTSKKIHQKLEQKVLVNADAVVVVGETMKENYLKFSNNIHVVTNGFDTNILSKKETIQLDKKFTITHIGLMNADRNPTILWNVLAEILSENNDFKNDVEIQLIGKVANEVLEALKTNQLKTNSIDYVPHDEVKKYQQKSQVLLLVVNNVPSAKGILTGKIFEYLQAKRPILAIGPEDGDVAKVIHKTNSGTIIDFNDVVTLKKTILALYTNYKKGITNISSKNIDQYHARNLTKKIAEIIKETLA
ncbi:MAG: glycosyltransferase family 4 protein [Polaribacter sp.]